MSPDAYLEMAETENHHWWFCGRRAILTRILGKLKLPPRARILEVGCGTGGNLTMLSQFGDVSALEVDDTARNLAIQKTLGAYDIRAGSCPEDIPFAGERFDLICLFDVLEHVKRDAATLHVLHGLLTPNGRLLLTVPAYEWLWGAHDVYLHHERRYGKTALSSKLVAAGFTVKRLSFFNTLLFPLAAFVRLKERFGRSKTAMGGALPAAPVNYFLRRTFSLERFILARMNLPFGVSLLAIAEARCLHASDASLL